MKQLTIPTFVVEGTADTLFTLKEAITNYEILKANKVPAKMLWFCGGHGVCLTGAGSPATSNRPSSPGSSAMSPVTRPSTRGRIRVAGR